MLRGCDITNGQWNGKVALANKHQAILGRAIQSVVWSNNRNGMLNFYKWQSTRPESKKPSGIHPKVRDPTKPMAKKRFHPLLCGAVSNASMTALLRKATFRTNMSV